MNVDEVIEAAMTLTPEERSHLVGALLASEQLANPEVSGLWDEAALRRAQEFEAGTVVGLSREELVGLLAERRAARAS